MKLHHGDDRSTLWHGDCLEVLRELADNSVDSIVTDPPYGLGFMGKAWDDLPPGVEWATECLRVLKPGGHLLAFGGSRTWHRLAAAVEDAGFEIRDSIAWLYGSGFPKSLDVSKAIDKARDDRPAVAALTAALADLADAAGITRAEIDAHMGTSDMGGWWLSRLAHRAACPSVENWTRLREFIPGAPTLDADVWHLNGRKGSPGEAWQNAEVVGIDTRYHEPSGIVNVGQGARRLVDREIKAPATPAAEQWQGWSTALKPAFEPVVVARKPLVGTVAANVLAHGTGALNIDGCRVGTEERTYGPSAAPGGNAVRLEGGDGRDADNARRYAELSKQRPPVTVSGRWPANVVLDESQAAALDEQSGTLTSGKMRAGTRPKGERETYGRDATNGYETRQDTPGDSGGASRFFKVAPIDELDARFKYVAKAPRSERPHYFRPTCECEDSWPTPTPSTARATDASVCGKCGAPTRRESHATVKPLALMRWLVRLVTPPGGTVLEPFAGSGTTVEACLLEGFRCIAIEREADYLPLIEARIARVQARPAEDMGLLAFLDDDEAAS